MYFKRKYCIKRAKRLKIKTKIDISVPSLSRFKINLYLQVIGKTV